MGLTPLPQMVQEVRRRVLDPEHGWPPEVRAVLRTKLGLPKEEAKPSPPAASATTNAPVEKVSSK